MDNTANLTIPYTITVRTEALQEHCGGKTAPIGRGSGHFYQFHSFYPRLVPFLPSLLSQMLRRHF